MPLSLLDILDIFANLAANRAPLALYDHVRATTAEKTMSLAGEPVAVAGDDSELTCFCCSCKYEESGEGNMTLSYCRQKTGLACAGEWSGDDKFSNPLTPQDGWKPVDHYAKLLHWVIKTNRKNKNGIFFGKGLSDSEFVCRAWALIKYEEYNCAPSRQNRRDRPQKLPRIGIGVAHDVHFAVVIFDWMDIFGQFLTKRWCRLIRGLMASPWSALMTSRWSAL